ncbi:MAG TPA: alpha/beta fold hydrolase [Bryobacterales bacterium]|nr:alpha/beta fold hydrolase [Bryobacterales bacterium]
MQADAIAVTRASSFEPFAEEAAAPAVRGFLHRAAGGVGDGLVLTHGAGSNCRAPLLAAVAEAFAQAGFTVLRCDLPFRQARPTGPPLGTAALDREGLRRALEALRRIVPGRLFLGGHSYGGRQATLLAAEEPGLAEGLLLLSYPLHPPRRPAELRTAHFPRLQTPAVFVHGARDPFGSIEEMRAALALIPGPAALAPIEGGSHSLRPEAAAEALAAFRRAIAPAA